MHFGYFHFPVSQRKISSKLSIAKLRPTFSKILAQPTWKILRQDFDLEKPKTGF